MHSSTGEQFSKEQGAQTLHGNHGRYVREEAFGGLVDKAKGSGPSPKGQPGNLDGL